MGALFPGTSEADQVYKICSVLGTPTVETWPEGIKLAAQMGFRYPPFVPTPLAQVVPNASLEALALLEDLLQFDPCRRPTANHALQHTFFQPNSTLAPAAQSESESGVSKENKNGATTVIRHPIRANSYPASVAGVAEVRSCLHKNVSYFVISTINRWYNQFIRGDGLNDDIGLTPSPLNDET